jgi:hypothetical protein
VVKKHLQELGIVDVAGNPKVSAAELVRLLSCGSVRYERHVGRGEYHTYPRPTRAASKENAVLVVRLSALTTEHGSSVNSLMGATVLTTKPNLDLRKEWTEEGWKSKKWKVVGVVISEHDSHGLYYEVRHSDGTIGCYDPSELQLI